jgi:hypothetical protein
MESEEFYNNKMRKILVMNDVQWKKVSGGLPEEDKRCSLEYCKKGMSLYAIKYNQFMGVISDYFLQDMQ